MAAIKKSPEELYTDFQDNTQGLITAQDMRNFVASVQNISGQGWAAYYDSTYTDISPRTVSAGVRTKVTIDSSTAIETELPYDVVEGNGTFWNNTTNKFLPQNIGDFYVMRFQFKAKAPNTPMEIATEVEIPAAGVSGTNVIYTHDVTVSKGNNVTHGFSYIIPLFNLDVSAGAEFYITPSDTASFWDFGLIVSRLYRGSLPLE